MLCKLPQPAHPHSCPSCLSVGSALGLITSYPLFPPIQDAVVPDSSSGTQVLSFPHFLSFASSLVIPLSREPRAPQFVPTIYLVVLRGDVLGQAWAHPLHGRS